MAYRNKTYAAFDADSDIHYYRLMTAWKQNDNTAFNFHDAHDLNNIMSWSSEETVKRRLRERMNNTKVFVLLVGASTKHLYKYVRWEVVEAQARNLPIIAVNLNMSRGADYDRLPPVVRDDLSVSVPFSPRILQHALEAWPADHYAKRRAGEKGAFHYVESTYRSLGM